MLHHTVEEVINISIHAIVMYMYMYTDICCILMTELNDPLSNRCFIYSGRKKIMSGKKREKATQGK